MTPPSDFKIFRTLLHTVLCERLGHTYWQIKDRNQVENDQEALKALWTIVSLLLWMKCVLV